MPGSNRTEALDLEHELFEQSRVPSLILDLNARQIVKINAAVERLLGLPREQIVGRPARDFLAEELPDTTLRERGLRGVAMRTIRVVEGATGRRVAEITTTPTSIEGVVFVQLFDLTELLSDDRIDEATQERSVDADRVLDAMPVATIIVDLVTRHVTRVNPEASELLGIPASQVFARPVTSLVGNDEEIEALLQSIGDDETGRSQTAVMLFSTAEGDKAVEVTAVALLDTPSAVLHVVPAAPRRPTRRVARPRRQMPEHDGGDAVDPARRRRFQVVCGSSLVALGAIVLVVGWWLGVDIVTRIAPDLASMKANTAIGFLLIGGGLLVPDIDRYRTVRFLLAAALLAIGLATVVEYGVDVDLGIDQLVATDTNLAGTSSPGRMGLNTAICFGAIGLGVLLTERRRTSRQVVGGQIGVILSGALAFLALLAYTYGASSTRGLASSTEMALHTSIAVIVSCAGILSTQLDRGLIAPLGQPFAGGRYARRFMPVGVAAIVASGLAAKALAGRDVLTDPDLELAFFALLVTASLFVIIVAVSRQTNSLDRRVERSRRDLATVMAAFSDRHYRVDRAGLARPVTGARVSEQTPVVGLVPKDVRDRLTNALEVSRTENRITELTFAPTDGDGRLELRVAPLPSQEVAVSIRDISELAAARDALAALTESLEDDVRARTTELEDTNEELERSNADLEQFAYLASHDLQEPLRMVSTFVDKLAKRLGDDLDDRAMQYIGFAVDGAERMSDLIDGLLQYSRAGRSDAEPVRIELDDVVPSVLQTLAKSVEEQGAVVEIADQLPAVHTDAVLLRQVLQNLIGNALKFVDPDRPAEVRIDGRRAGPMVEIRVSDNGVGIAPEFRDQVFLMFRRLHSRASYGGTGIGLSLVQRLVESLGGKVWIDPDHGPHGSCFVFTVPAAEAHEKAMRR
ncbi:MAG: ATP-binding protein [Acidimicrobiales bacterium]|nr:ATP-binding protein [Acidimicrobiales bacterium]